MSVSVLGKSVKSPALESSGVMKNGFYSTLQCTVPSSPESSNSGDLRGVMQFTVPLSARLFLPVVGRFWSRVVNGLAWGCLGLKLSKTRHLPGMKCTELWAL